MGYRLSPRVVKVQLRNTEFDGAEARVSMCSAAEMLEALQHGDRGLVKVLVDHMLDWKIETEEGDPVPCDKKSIESVDSDLVLSLAIGYMRGATRTARDRPTPPADENLNGTTAGPAMELL